jgi:hypothetical protein
LIGYDILYLFNANGFPPGGSGQSTCTTIGNKHLYKKGETIHKTIQNIKQIYKTRKPT